MHVRLENIVSNGEQLQSVRNPSLLELPEGAQRAFSRDGYYGLGESYIGGEWQVPELDRFLYELLEDPRVVGARGARIRILLHALAERLLNPQQGMRSFNIGKVHYGLGNKLFERMLGKSMSYTCGYFNNTTNLDQAQYQKLDLTCRKLKLKPGMRVLDIGCGWGNFARFASSHYGVDVFGVTVSEEQARFAREFCKGLPVDISVQDYRSIKGNFDCVVSIEMIEAVGRKNLPTYFDVVDRALKPGGLFCLEAISCETVSSSSNIFVDQLLIWIVKRIFPDGYIPKISELARPGEKQFVIEDWHNFGADYDATLMGWHENFNRYWDELHGDFDEQFKRCWNYYLSSCAAFFRARLIQLYQIVYSKGGTPGGYNSER